MNRYSGYFLLKEQNQELINLVFILGCLLLLLILRNTYNYHKKCSYKKKNNTINQRVQETELIIQDYELKLKNAEKIKEKIVQKENELIEIKQKKKDLEYKLNSLLNKKNDEILKQREVISQQKQAYERYVDFKNVEANNTRLGAHFIKNIISQIYEDMEETELSYKTFLGIDFRRAKRKNKIPSIKALKNIFRLLDYNVSSLKKENITINEELEHINMFIELIQYLKPNTKIIVNNSLSKHQVNTIKIKPTLFFPFLENALKHGSLNQVNSFINIDLKKNDQNNLSYCLVNSIELYQEKTLKEKETSEFGLNALKQLINVYYPGSKIKCAPLFNGQYLAELTLAIK